MSRLRVVVNHSAPRSHARRDARDPSSDRNGALRMIAIALALVPLFPGATLRRCFASGHVKGH